MKCLDVDTLISLSQVLEWRADDALSHLAQCTECRNRLYRLRQLHTGLTAETQVSEELTERILASLPIATRNAERGQSGRAPGSLPSLLLGQKSPDSHRPRSSSIQVKPASAGVGLLTGLTSFIAIMPAAGGDGEPMTLLVIVSLVVGLIGFLHTQQQSARRGSTTT